MNPITDIVNPSEPIIEDVNKSTEAYIVKNDKLNIFLYIVAFAVSAFVIIRFNLDGRLAILPILIGVIGYNHIRSNIKRQFTQQFAASVGFSYAASASIDTVAGKLFRLGHGQSIYDVLSGKHNGRDSRMFSYCFTVGSGKNSHTYYFTVFEATFSNMMPDIVLSAKTGLFSSTPSIGSLSLFDGSTHVELEGDFNEYFTIRVPKGYETEVYQILPPDVMANLIDRAKDLNFEFYGNKLYIYATKLILQRDKLQAMFDLAQYLEDLFSRSTRAVNVPTRSPDQNL
jgi:hypothetical protein